MCQALQNYAENRNSSKIKNFQRSMSAFDIPPQLKQQLDKVSFREI